MKKNSRLSLLIITVLILCLLSSCGVKNNEKNKN